MFCTQHCIAPGKLLRSTGHKQPNSDCSWLGKRSWLCACRLEKLEDGSIDFYYRGTDGQVKSMNCGLVLFGTGRKPIVWDMGLEVSLMHAFSLPCCQQSLLALQVISAAG